MNTTFSVSICVYGKDDPIHFKIAVDSILCQTRQPDEVVLVVDGSVPDSLLEIINDYELLSVFKVIWLPVNQGHGNARRVSLENCKNSLVALMDADDISVSDRFEKQLNLFEGDSELDVVGGNIAEFIGEPINVIGKRVVPQDDIDIKAYMKTRCPMNQVTVMFKKERVVSVGGYIDWYCEEDYYLWLRMALNGFKFANINEILVNVRAGEDMYRRRGGWKYFSSEAKLQKFMLENGVVSICLFICNVMKRFIVQVILPNRLRAWVYKTFARNEA